MEIAYHVLNFVSHSLISYYHALSNPSPNLCSSICLPILVGSPYRVPTSFAHLHCIAKTYCNSQTKKPEKKEIYSSRPPLMILAMMFEGYLVDIVLCLYSSKDNKEVVSRCFYPDLPNCDDVAIEAIGVPTVAHFDS